MLQNSCRSDINSLETMAPLQHNRCCNVNGNKLWLQVMCSKALMISNSYVHVHNFWVVVFARRDASHSTGSSRHQSQREKSTYRDNSSLCKIYLGNTSFSEMHQWIPGRGVYWGLEELFAAKVWQVTSVTQSCHVTVNVQETGSVIEEDE